MQINIIVVVAALYALQACKSQNVESATESIGISEGGRFMGFVSDTVNINEMYAFLAKDLGLRNDQKSQDGAAAIVTDENAKRKFQQKLEAAKDILKWIDEIEYSNPKFYLVDCEDKESYDKIRSQSGKPSFNIENTK